MVLKMCVTIHEHKSFEFRSLKRAFMLVYIDFLLEVLPWTLIAEGGVNVAWDTPGDLLLVHHRQHPKVLYCMQFSLKELNKNGQNILKDQSQPEHCLSELLP